MREDLNILDKKINNFRSKFLRYQFTRGTIILILIAIVIFLLLTLLEYQIYMSSMWRKISFLTASLFVVIVAFRYVLLPFSQWIGILNILDDKKVSIIINKLIPGIKDKLFNVLELRDMNPGEYSEVIRKAAITQKIRELNLFDFSEAISWRNLRNLFQYLVISFLIVVGIYAIDSHLIVQPADRIIHFNQKFVKPAPYLFKLLNSTLRIEKGKDLKIKVECIGDELPDIVYVNIEGSNFMMKATTENSFEYEIPSVINNLQIYFTDLKFNSESFLVDIIPVPVINKFTIEVYPPLYTGINHNEIQNVGDFNVPEGSNVKWIFECYDTDSLKIFTADSTIIFAEKQNVRNFTISRKILKETNYFVSVKNDKKDWENIMNFKITIKPDQYPEINVIEIVDSLQLTKYYFKGQLFDDYGFTQLKFHTDINQKDSSLSIQVIKNLINQDFYFGVDFNDYKIQGKTIYYYFTISDNDEVNGPKTTSSKSFFFTFPDKKEINEKITENSLEIDKLLRESKELADELKNNVKDLQMKNLNNSVSEWDKTQMMNDILEKKDWMENLLDKIEKANQSNNIYENSFNEESDEILNKQKQIEKLLQDVMTDELKKLMEEFEKLAEEFNSKQLNDLSQKMNLTFEDLNKQLDRNIEMLKRMKIEREIKDVVERVEKVKENQKNSMEEILKNKNYKESTESNNQDLIETDSIQKDIRTILRKNEELKRPYKFDDFNKEFQEIKEGMKNTNDELSKKNAKNSSKGFERNKELLESLLFAMKQMIKSNEQEQNTEDIANIKQILKNLVYVSFEQEKILKNTSVNLTSDPLARQTARNQRKLNEQSKIIKDSLYALSLRNAQVSNIVNNELMNMDINLIRASELLSEGISDQAIINQQIVITSVNNLALLLSDILKNMEEEMANNMPGDSNCEKPGKKGGMGTLKNQSENIREQLQRMIDALKRGEKSNQNRGLSQAMMQHEMMQKMLREIMNNGNIGSDARNQLQQIDQLLEQNRRELMNKRINTQLIQRQNEIMTRLLEAEDAERERDQENRRESNTARQDFYSITAKELDNNRLRNFTLENFQRSNLKLNIFYQNKFKNYIENCSKDATQ